MLLTAANTYTGPTNVNSGTLALGFANSPPGPFAAFYQYDGYLNDSSGNGNAASISRIPATFGVSANPNLGQALQLPGSQYATIPYSSSLNLTNSFTVSTWFKANTITDVGLVSTRTGGEYTFDMQLLNNTTIHGDVGNGSSWISTGVDETVPTITPGTWHMVTYVITHSGATLYFDGVQRGSITAGFGSLTPTLMKPGQSLTMGFDGAYSSLPNSLDGSLDDVAVIGRALSASDVAMLFNSSSLAGSSLASTTALSVNSGATFNLGGTTQTVASLANGASGGGSVNLAGGVLTINNTLATSSQFGGVISGAGGLAAIGTGALTLSGPNSYTGATTLTNGSLLLGNSAALGASAVQLGDVSGSNSVSLLTTAAMGLSISNPITVMDGTTNNTIAIGGTNTSGNNSFTGQYYSGSQSERRKESTSR